MRVLSVSLALLVATGCTSNQVNFEHTSKVETATRGVALVDDAPEAQVGMGGNTCAVETGSGMIGADYDVAAGEADNVQDAVGSDVIVVGVSGVYQLDSGFGGLGDPDVRLSNVLESRLTDDSITTLAGTGEGNCTLSWHNGGDAQGSVEIADGCDGNATLDVDRRTGRAFVGTGNGLVVADPTGESSTIAGDYDLVVWDAAANALYVAAVGGNEVSALESDGSTRWTVEVPGQITSMDDMGPMASVAVMTGNASGGDLLVLDGETGAQTSDVVTPGAADRVIVGNNGHTVAMVLPERVHFYTANLIGE